ncbi:hypothetical protein TcasGA2_TC003530 [Tribolium castaneum]|uniref:Uncharacterized protein n=1 Tax=Tribolium castaneum TaxID=7070 RepID=D6WHE7_TRICA|nr:hypothetical protein TcasGA2_TC003530 [Tribolium castaneum]
MNLIYEVSEILFESTPDKINYSCVSRRNGPNENGKRTTRKRYQKPFILDVDAPPSLLMEMVNFPVYESKHRNGFNTSSELGIDYRVVVTSTDR